MATSKLSFDEGTDVNVATNTISEDAVTKHINRTVLNTSAGVEVSPLTDTQLRATAVPISSATLATAAKQDTGNTSLGTIDTSTAATASGVGATADAAATAGSTGSLSAKLRLATSQLDSIKTSVETIDNIVSGAGANITQVGGTNIDTNSGAKSAGTQRTILASDDPAVTSLAIMDDWDESDRAKVNVIVGQAGVAAGVGATGATVQRIVQANDAGKTIVSTGGSAASSGNNTLVSAGTNKLKVFAFSLSTTSTTSVTCIFQSGASGTELWRVVLQAISGSNTGANLVVQPPAYLFATGSATLLNLNLSSAQTVHWSVAYFDES